MMNLKNVSSMHCPNELGRVHVSFKTMSITPLEVQEESIGDAMAKNSSKRQNKKSKDINETNTSQNINKKAIDAIWKHLGLGHIDISYACIGYSTSGRPILNHDELVSLLVNYGFNINDIVPFVDDFAAQSEKDSKSPIVMFSANTSAIMTNIEPIV